jgi:hypothetical protein
MMAKPEDLAGRQFGWLTVREFAGSDNQNHALWRCLCGCGGETIVRAYSLKLGSTTSCGCRRALRMRKMHEKARVGRKSSYLNKFDDLNEFLTS